MTFTANSNTTIVTRHNPAGNYSQLDNSPVRNKNLSTDAKALLWYLGSNSDKWYIVMKNVQEVLGIGINRLRKAFAQLAEWGYVIRTQLRDASVAAKCKVILLKGNSYTCCFKYTAAFKNRLHIVAQHRHIGDFAAWVHVFRDGYQPACASLFSQTVDYWLIRHLKGCFSPVSVQWLICHSISQYYNVFH